MMSLRDVKFIECDEAGDEESKSTTKGRRNRKYNYVLSITLT